MTIFNQVENAFQFIGKGMARLFGPDDNTYPETGVQPFTGDPYDKVKQRHDM
ncbi:MAG: isochorismate synthase [Merismopedia sp. SIO2A8]|nr:isochorismate synthase [Symploca sp. SIO2B6]NET49846.1 isochorismate synthase [Merismopedia sp. SIO2A8]